MDRRQSFRFPCSPERSSARVELPGRSCAATLIDESTGGFRLQVNETELGCEPDQQLQLQTYRGWHEVRVVRFAPCEEGVELGLLRLEDYVDEGSTLQRRKPRRKYRRHATFSMRGEYLIGLLIILVVPLMPVLFQQFVIPDQVVAVGGPESDEPEVPSLAGKSSQFFYAKTSRTSSSIKPAKQVSRKPANRAQNISRAADQVIGAGTQGVKKVLEGTVQVVHEVLASLSLVSRGRLEEVVEDYTASPSNENLHRIESLLEEPEYDSLHQIVADGRASVPQLAGILVTEFHRN